MSNKAKIREEAKKLNPIDDLLFRKMAEDRGFCEEILRVILEDKDLVVVTHHSQHAVTNPQGRSIILDAHCVLGNGTEVDIEVQKANDDDHQRRVRYTSNVLTTNIVDPGEKFHSVPDVIVVFISRFDVFKAGRAIYHVDRVVRETGKVAYNGFSEVYITASVRDGSEVSELMQVFVEDNAYSQKFPITSATKHRFKETEEGVEIMCEIIEDLIKRETKGFEDHIAQMEAKQRKMEAEQRKMEAEQRKMEKRSSEMEDILRAHNLPIPPRQ